MQCSQIFSQHSQQFPTPAFVFHLLFIFCKSPLDLQGALDWKFGALDLSPGSTTYLCVLEQILTSKISAILIYSFSKCFLNNYYVPDIVFGTRTQQRKRNQPRPLLHGPYVLKLCTLKRLNRKYMRKCGIKFNKYIVFYTSDKKTIAFTFILHTPEKICLPFYQTQLSKVGEK